MRRTPLGFGKRIAAERPKRYEPNRKLEEYKSINPGEKDGTY